MDDEILEQRLAIGSLVAIALLWLLLPLLVPSAGAEPSSPQAGLSVAEPFLVSAGP